jgi:CheY-like chemotaxis protein
MKTYRILVVDDEPKVAFFFQKHLEMVGEQYLAKAVNSGQDALAELQKHHYDLMITDLRMPHMDGLELLNHVREISPETKTILVTAYGGKAVWQEAERLNTFRALSKPVRINDLLTAVRESLVPTTPTSPATPKMGIMALTGETYKALNADLEELRVNLGARAVVLADTAGQVLTTCGTLEDLELSSTMALLGGTVGASNALAQQLQFQKPTHLTFFEGPPYDLYVANVSEHFFVSIWQDRKQAGKIGMVWLYTQRTVEKVTQLLETSIGEEALVDAGFVTAVQSDLDDLFSLPTTPAPARSAPAPSGGLPDKVSQIASKFSTQTGIIINAHVDPKLEAVPLPASKLVLRAIAESLKNVYQHAHATEVQIELYCDDESLMGRISDNGRGFDMMRPPTLREMGELQELFRQKEGSLVLTGSPQNGTSVSFQLPGKGVR